MPTHNNAAHKYGYPDYEDELELPAPPRRTTANVPPTHRIIGGGQITRQQAVLPQPLQGAGRRAMSAGPNVPPPVSRGAGEEVTRRSPARPANRRPAPTGGLIPRVNVQRDGSTVRLALLGAALLAVLVLSYLIVSFAVHTWQTWQDDMTYGRPRITRLETNVGHNETGGNKTIFIAQNIKGQISITEFPGGDPSKTRVIVGPQLFGKDKDLVPIKLQAKDVNADGQPDLIAQAEDQVLIYINDNSTFRPIKDDERARLNALDKDNNK